MTRQMPLLEHLCLVVEWTGGNADKDARRQLGSKVLNLVTEVYAMCQVLRSIETFATPHLRFHQTMWTRDLQFKNISWSRDDNKWKHWPISERRDSLGNQW